MRRLLKALLLLVMSVVVGQAALAQGVKPIVQVSGRLSQSEYRVFTKDTLYQIVGDYRVSGVLLIEPGTTVEFVAQGRLIDSVGGKIIADGELEAIWDRNTSAVTSFPNRYCDVDYLRAHVSRAGRPEVTAQGGPNGAPNWVNYAPWLFFYYANDLDRCGSDPNQRLRQYKRDVIREPIIFRGRPVNQFSNEWGHIVILPGADTAVFRNVQFVNFRKDTHVVRNEFFYNPTAAAGYNNEEVLAGSQLNLKLRNLTTGGGGAMTVMSSKTWILNARFDSNMARYHGGAVQFLQAPFDDYTADPAADGFYPVDPSLGAAHGPNTYPADLNSYLNTVDEYSNTISTPVGSLITMTVTVPADARNNTGPVQYRPGYDDGRQAINQGRVRRLYFRDNRAMVASVINDTQGYRDDPNTPPPVITDAFTGGIAKNEAWGGAMYLSGRRYDTIYFGRGRGILAAGFGIEDPTDTVIFERNYAVNFQADSAGGAKGGAIYVGDSTALDFEMARFVDNFTATPNVPETDWYRRSHLSQGGGIYMSKTSPFLNIDDNVLFSNNRSGQGGGIFVEAVVNPFGMNIPVYDPFLSPNLVGDSVRFVGNVAEYDGGAIYTMRNMLVEGKFITSEDPGTGAVIDRRIVLDSNSAGLAGGAIVVDNQTNFLESNARIINALFAFNAAGDSARVNDTRLIQYYDPVANPQTLPTNPYGISTLADNYQLPTSIRQHIIGGGAVYTRFSNTNLYRAIEFRNNWTVDGNGGAVSMVTPVHANRFFVADGDVVYNYSSSFPGGNVLTFDDGPEPTDMRQMTRFLGNRAVKGGVTPILHPRDTSTLVRNTLEDPYRNGVGLGGGVYINDNFQFTGGSPGVPRTDSTLFHRVRFEQDSAWSGAAVYSDNFYEKILLTKSLVAGNRAESSEGRTEDVITNYKTQAAASRTAGAILYGEIQGPLPLEEYHTGANSIYDNDGRFLIRAADAPEGTLGLGLSGADTLRGNFWGRLEAPVTTILPTGTQQETYFIQGDSCYLPLMNSAVVNQQGPFESKFVYNYAPVPVGLIPDTLLLEGRVYDIFDKGEDIRAVDYRGPRMSPIEDFAVGIPPELRRYPVNSVYEGKVVRRLTRDPFIVDIDPIYAQLQREFVGDHPIGYPLFLETRANYLGNPFLRNDDPWALNHTVFFVINVETGEMIRANMKQFSEGSDIFRGRIEFVPDSINRQPLARRDQERRAAFSVAELYRLMPRYYMDLGFSLEEARLMAARYEDSVALDGRRYGGSMGPGKELGGASFDYINRNNYPSFVNVYAGERYRALPVLTGDRVWVISRTMLWNVDSSRTIVEDLAGPTGTGLEFTISNENSVPAPVIRGQIDQLRAKTPAELRNTRFLWEDRTYASDPTGADTSQIFDVTAFDVNGFYDPRFLYFPDRYTALRFEWTPLQEFFNGLTVPSRDPSQVRLASWLKADTVFPANVAPGAVAMPPRDSINRLGYLRFYGQPHNPDVVPGGEILEVKVSNYPPGIQTIDSLRGVLPDDVVARYIFLYPPYFNCQVYDPLNARYLQQDTVNVGGATTTSYRLRIFVQDSVPQFLGSVPKCYDPVRDVVFAQWTNRLRYNYDVNTDDENEDNAAAAEGWDFRYGRTTYGFRFTVPADQNPGGAGPITDDVNEVRPIWLADEYLHDEDLAADEGATFMRNGNIVVRIDSSEAANLLRNPVQANNTFNLDSVYTVYVNDGHTGQAKSDFEVLVNAQPVLLPVPPNGVSYLDAPLPTLPNAKEDVDYNRTMLDTTRMIRALDLNRGQRVLYTLVYRDDALNSLEHQTGFNVIDEDGNTVTNTATTAYVRRDSCYTEAGLYPAPKTTPSWLKINPISGILYGTPGLNDAPLTDTVTVVATDEYGLTDVRVYILQVDSTQHPPILAGGPPVRCIVAGEDYKDEICVSDRDLGRTLATETVTLTAFGTAEGVTGTVNFTVNPATLTSTMDPDSCHKLEISATAGAIGSNFFGRRMTISVVARDLAGNTDTLRYVVSVSPAVDFAMDIITRNTNITDGNAFQVMTFGLAQNATTGEDSSRLGFLDSIYCEYELPPLPPQDVFDARWVIPTNNGILRNFHPTVPPSGQERTSWKAKFQPGFLEGGSPNFPIVICWSISAAQESDSALYIMDLRTGPTGEVTAFRVNMKNPTEPFIAATTGVRVYTNGGDTACVEIIAPGIAEGYQIFYGVDETTDVPSVVTGDNGVQLFTNTPNPFTSATDIAFSLPKRSEVKLEVFDGRGALVRTLVDRTIEAGRESVVWDGRDAAGRAVASGSYTYRLTVGEAVLSKTMILTR